MIPKPIFIIPINLNIILKLNIIHSLKYQRSKKLGNNYLGIRKLVFVIIAHLHCQHKSRRIHVVHTV